MIGGKYAAPIVIPPTGIRSYVHARPTRFPFLDYYKISRAVRSEPPIPGRAPTRFQFFSRGTETAKLGEEPRDGVVRPCNIEKMRPQKDSEDQ
jgi:hypothetical protein